MNYFSLTQSLDDGQDDIAVYGVVAFLVIAVGASARSVARRKGC